MALSSQSAIFLPKEGTYVHLSAHQTCRISVHLPCFSSHFLLVEHQHQTMIWQEFLFLFLNFAGKLAKTAKGTSSFASVDSGLVAGKKGLRSVQVISLTSSYLHVPGV